MAKKTKNDLEEVINDIENFSNTKVDESEICLCEITDSNLIGCGSTVMNLKTSGIPTGCFLKGTMNLLIGASGAGKTWLCYNTLAEATKNKNFEHYRLIVDNVENGAHFDVQKYFGKKTAARIEQAWDGREDEAGHPNESSVTVEDFFDNVTKKCKEANKKDGAPFIYILDSMDCLTSSSSDAKAEEDMKAREKGKEANGSYGDGKAKVISENLRRICSLLKLSGSILIIICQEKDDITSRIPGTKRFSGGKSLEFYATNAIWLKKKSVIKAVIKGIERNLGVTTKVDLIKNRLTGIREKFEMDIYHSFGIDDLGGIVDFLLDEGHWKDGKVISSPEFDEEIAAFMTSNKLRTFDKEKLISWVEDNGYEERMREIANDVYNGVKDLISKKVQRKQRYE